MISVNNLLKVVLLGESGVGKTALLDRFVNKKFTATYKSTIGADFLTQEIEIDEKLVTLQIWDTAGQERFNSLGKVFYRGADCCMFVFDVTRTKTLASLEFWKHEFEENAVASTNLSTFPFLVIGNRADLESERTVSQNDAADWCKRHGGLKYMETSARTGFNVEKAFTLLASEVIRLNFDQKPFLPKSPEVDIASMRNYDGDKKQCSCSNLNPF